LAARQSGKSLTIAVFALWYAIFNNNKIIGIVSNKEKSAKGFLSKIKGIYERLPVWMKPGVLEYNKKDIEFDNGTKITVSATTADAFRSFTINFLICDELAFVPKNQAEDFWSANYPTISASKESRVIVISTPNGLFNLFHNLYTGGESGKNTFKTFKATWRDVPGRDESWAAEQKKNLGIVKFNQEHECNFIGSSQTLIEASVLENLALSYIEPLLLELNDNFRIYEKPQKDILYVIGADVATGSGGDYSTCQVLKINTTEPLKAEQVAVYENNIIDTYTFGDIVSRIGTYYNGAYVMIENNAEGSVVVNQVWYGNEYENLFNENNKKLGIRATRRTKVKAAMLMKRLIEDGSIKIVDKMTISQLADYIDKKGKLGGKSLNDDLVTGLYWSCYFFDSKILKVILNPNKKIQTKSDNVFGIITDDWSSSWSDVEDGRAIIIESF
jgi:hypothetical protein